MSVISLDLGGTKLAAACFTDENEPIAHTVVPLEGRKGEAVGVLIIETLNSIREQCRSENIEINAIGVSVPGIFDVTSGCVWAPNIPGWEQYPLFSTLQNAAPETCSIRIAGDRACYILGETWQGCARESKDAIFVAVGTGIGAGILSGGRVLRGHGDIAGAIGWMALDQPYRPEYESCGCFEYHASGPGIVKVARELMTLDPGYSGILRKQAAGYLSTEDIFAAFEAGDPIGKRTIEQAIIFWGMAAANLVSLFDPEVIIFGGGVFGPASRFIGRIYEEATRWGQPISMKHVRFEVSHLGGDAGLFGAARLALLEENPIL